MPLRALIDGRFFDAETTAAMTEAYEAALATFGVKDRTDPLTRMIAEAVVAIVDGGTRTREDIYEQTVAKFRTEG